MIPFRQFLREYEDLDYDIKVQDLKRYYSWNTEYGAWVNLQQRKFFYVRTMGHGAAARDYLRHLLGNADYGQEYFAMMDRGWLRVMHDGERLSVEGHYEQAKLFVRDFINRKELLDLSTIIIDATQPRKHLYVSLKHNGLEARRELLDFIK